VLISLPHLLYPMRNGYSSGTIVTVDGGSVLV
jgi:hypothetical protein